MLVFFPGARMANIWYSMRDVLVQSYFLRSQLSRNDNMPSTLWLWDMNKLRLTAIIGNECWMKGRYQYNVVFCVVFWMHLHVRVGHIGMVRSARWDPAHNRIAVCTSNSRVSDSFSFSNVLKIWASHECRGWQGLFVESIGNVMAGCSHRWFIIVISFVSIQ